ncbi:MAG: hypothetical protein CBC20_06025 [Verrucomicrobia bacterium TMED60]|nr:MAG: hypothetical protein CBC20_06025 [Verrucomicrobia bacterium TMED60]|tara:strand:+ start:292 stop:729 length:438 start_codon:yes stop_codon:yes gene_type:complete
MNSNLNFSVFILIIGLFMNSSCEQKEAENSATESMVLPVQETKIENIKAMEAAKMLEKNPDMMVLDIRTPEEFNSGHIPTSMNIDYKAENFELEIKKLDRSKPYLMHCRSGRRSTAALDTFRKHRFDHIIHIDDGILGWNKELTK